MRGRLLLGCAVLAVCATGAPPPAFAVPRVYTLAGDGRPGLARDGEPAGLVRAAPSCVAALPDGSVLMADGARVQRIGPDGRLATVAGTGAFGFSGDGGPATRARIAGCGLAALPDGGLLLADGGNNRIRRVGRDGIIATIAGTGGEGSSGDGGLALQARLGGPRTLVARGGSVLVLTEEATLVGDSSSLLRRIDRTGRIRTLAGVARACDGAEGQPATQLLIDPSAISPAADGGFLLADESGCVLRLSARGWIATVVDGASGSALAGTPDGGFLVASQGEVRRVGPDGHATVLAGCEGAACAAGDGPARTVALGEIRALAAEPGGGFVLATSHRVARVDGAGALSTVARIEASSLAREAGGALLAVHPSAGAFPAAGTVMRIASGGGAARVVAGGGTADPRPGLRATAVALAPTGVQALPGGFAVLEGDRGDVVFVGGDGTIAQITSFGRISPVGGFAVLADGALAVVRGGEGTHLPRVYLLRGGVWSAVAGPLAPKPGLAATNVAISGDEGFAPLAGGRLLVQAGLAQLWLRGDGTIERVTHHWTGTTPLAPRLGGTALFAGEGRVGRLAADGSVATLVGGGHAGFFGSSDGQPARRAELGEEVAVAGLAAMRDGSLLIAQSDPDQHVGRVLWIASDRTRRLGVAITRRSLPLLRRHRIAVRTTLPARILLEVRRRGRLAGRTRTNVPAGETSIALPPRLAGGLVTVTVRATSRDHQRAWTSHRFLYGSFLPMWVARRSVFNVETCRRVNPQRVACIRIESGGGGTAGFSACIATAVFLRRNGVVYVRDGEEVERCSTRWKQQVLHSEKAIWHGGEEAPPLRALLGKTPGP